MDIGDASEPAAQWTALDEKLKALEGKYPDASIHGHNEYAAKECPGFDVQEWLEGGPRPQPSTRKPPGTSK